MPTSSPSTPSPRDRLAAAGLRVTPQRELLAALLFGEAHRHVTAEQLLREVRAHGERVALATVYNTLHHLVEVGLLRALEVDGQVTTFDTNTAPHHHWIDERTGELHDLPLDAVALRLAPGAFPEGRDVVHVDVVVRVR